MTGVPDWSTTPAANSVINGVTYWPTGMMPGQVDNTGRQMMADIKARFTRVINVFDEGVLGTAAANDTMALTALVAKVNAAYVLGDAPVAIVFPHGVYNYSTTLGFDIPVALLGANDATLNYTGTGYAVRLGPTNLLNSPIAFSFQEMSVDGLRFTGGQTASGGIYISDSIFEPRIRRVTFLDFGIAGSWCIYGQANNWNTLIDDCRLFSLNRTNAAPHFININGVSVNTVADGGNSRVTIRDCFMTSYNNTAMGVFARINAVASRVIGGGCQFASTGVGLVPSANDVTIDGFYCEIYTPNSQMIGVESSGSGSTYQCAQNVKLLNSYCNLHQEVPVANARVIKMVDAAARLTGWTINNLTYANIPANYTIIEQNNVPGQTGNRQSNVRALYVPSVTDSGARANFPLIQSLVHNWTSSDGVIGIKETGASYTLNHEDIGGLTILTGAAAVLTVPPSGATPNLPVGTRAEVRNATVGTQTVVGGSGVTLLLPSTGATGTRTMASNAHAELTCIGSNLWLVEGPGVS